MHFGGLLAEKDLKVASLPNRMVTEKEIGQVLESLQGKMLSSR